MPCSRWVPLLVAALPVFASVPPADWVPARWASNDPKSLELLSGTPINCLLLNHYTPGFIDEAAKRGIVTLAVIAPGGDAADASRKAVRAKMAGVVLEGDFTEGTAARVRDAVADSKIVIIELTSRVNMNLGGNDLIIGTYQGVWPGIQVMENGAAKAAPSGSPWIDTNSGFIRALRAWGPATVWMANRPPEKTVITGARYLQAIADAAMSGARWVLALDDDLASRLAAHDASAIKDWKQMGELLAFLEKHHEWYGLQSYGKLAVVQDPKTGGLLSGGILDMIAAKHTPVRPVPRERLSPDVLRGASMAVNVDADALSPEQREVLRSFTRGGGTLLTGPPGWKDSPPSKGQITLEKEQIDRLNDIWHDVQNMVGRKNLGARLFNVSSMLSNLLAAPDGKQVLLHVVNYSGYPVENVTVHFLANYKHAHLFTPDGKEKDLEIYSTDEGSGVDISSVSVWATVQLD